MKFVELDNLKPGMRLARPVYNKSGVLIYERGSAIKDTSAIQSFHSFGLIGIFVLEPTEPVPPMSEDDIEFERFQTMMTFQVKEELDSIIDRKKSQKLDNIASSIIKAYGHRKTKLTFTQGLRSKEDYYYKHALNVAILSALIAHAMNVSPQDQMEAVKASLVHDIGKIRMPASLYAKGELSAEDKEAITEYELKGHALLSEVFMTTPNLRRVAVQTQRILKTGDFGADLKKIKVFPATRIMTVAEYFDLLTAMQPGRDPYSEITVLREMRANPDVFDQKAIAALAHSITLLLPGTSVILSNGVKALVIRSGADILRPVVLTFEGNQIIDLTTPYGPNKETLFVKDTLKTLDNRVIMNDSALAQFGFQKDARDAEVVQDAAYVPEENDIASDK